MEEAGGDAVHGGPSYHNAVVSDTVVSDTAPIWHHARMKIPALAFALLAPAALAASPENGKPRDFSHAIKAGGIAEECLRLPAGKSRRFEWASDGPVDFNIHFHAGDKVTYPVKLNGQAKGGGRFTASSAEDYCWMWSAKSPATVTGSLGPEE